MDTCNVIGATQKTDVKSKVDLLVQNVNKRKKKKKRLVAWQQSPALYLLLIS